MNRDAGFYALLSGSLLSAGYDSKSNTAFHEWLNDTFKKKYDSEKTFAQEGFSVSPDFVNRWTQIEGNDNIFSLATYVDIDSPGAVKSFEGFELNNGNLPVSKHEINIDRKMVEEAVQFRKEFGKYGERVQSAFLRHLEKGADILLGGHQNTLLRQRHQVVSTGKLEISADNNPLGISFTFDFCKSYRTKNTTTSKWYSLSGDVATQEANVTNGTINPIQVLKKVKRDAEIKDGAGLGHFELSRKTWDALTQLPFFRDMYVVNARPEITDATMRKTYGGMVGDDVLKTFIEGKVGAKIRIIDSIARAEKFDKTSGSMNTYLDNFEAGVIVYVPNGEIGSVQFNKPMYAGMMPEMVSYFEDGRVMLRNIYDERNMRQTMESEMRALVVPNKARHMYFVKVA